MIIKQQAKLLRIRIQQLTILEQMREAIQTGSIPTIKNKYELLEKVIRRTCPECGALLNDEGLCSRFSK